MDENVGEEERAYWTREAEERDAAVRAARERGDPAFRLAALELRLDEARRRLAAM